MLRARVGSIDEALESARYGALHLVGNAGLLLSQRWPAKATPPFKVDATAAPDITWVAWLGAAVNPETAPPRPYYLRAPDVKAPAPPLTP
jgi:tRNA threonylcarbamoyladenosine biosynthesis protein TsaB